MKHAGEIEQLHAFNWHQHPRKAAELFKRFECSRTPEKLEPLSESKCR